MPAAVSVVIGAPGTRRRASPASRAERRLAASLRRGDQGALASVHAQYGPTVFGFLVRTLHDHAAAEDVFQQVLTEVWRRGPEYDPSRASMLTWILTIARSRAIDELRRRRPEPQDPGALPDQPVDAPQDDLLDRWRVSHLLRGLPEEERRLLELRFYGELSQTEIAQRTGLPLGTVKTRMVRALERLRAALDAEEEWAA